MPSISKSRIVDYTPEQMYNLVNDVESYPEFVIFCVSSKINEATPQEIRATLSFARGGLSKSFSTLNRLHPHKMIEIRLINGPFQHLEGFWRFQAVEGNQCHISLDLEFEFSSRWLAAIFGPLFHQITIRLVEAFSERATVVYGKALNL